MEMAVTGELIQMNAHMVTSTGANVVMFIGVGLFICSLILAATCWPGKKVRLKYWIPFFAFVCLMAASAGLVVYGSKMPRQQIVKACANGPISLELISSRYDILDVDGKELTLRVRGS